MGSLFHEALTRPIVNILMVLYQGFSVFDMPYALGFSIIGLTIVIRVILYPLMASQLRVSKKMQDIAPHVSRVKEKHKGDAKRVQEETMRLYKEHGINPFAGCLPTLVQLPIIWALYSVLQQIVSLSPQAVVAEVNKMLYAVPFLKLTSPWDPTFFGMPLGKHPSELLSAMPLLLLIPLVTAVLQFIQSKMMMSLPTEDTKEVKKDDFASAMQTQTLYVFPVMIGFLSYTFPIGLSLYWNTFTLFGILQQYQMQGWGGLTPWIAKLRK